MTVKKDTKKKKEGATTKTTTAEAAVKKTEERQGPLTPDAWEHYTALLDKTGTNRRGEITGTSLMGFLPLPDVRRLANRNAGGLGQLLRPIDFIYINLVDEAKMREEEIFVDGLKDIVKAKMDRNWDLLPHEELCYRFLMAEKKEKVTDIFDALGITKESVEMRKLVKPLTKEEIDFFVKVDGKKEECCLYDEEDTSSTCSEFQPVRAYKVRSDLARLVEGGWENLSIQDALVTDNQTGEKVEVGSFVIGPDPNDPENRVLIHAAHGHPTWVEYSDHATKDASRGFRGPDWLLQHRVVQNRRGHLGLARVEAYSARTGANGFDFCFSRAAAEKELAEVDGRANRISRLKTRRQGLFGKKNSSSHHKPLLGGLGKTE